MVFWAETPDRSHDEEAEDWMAGLLDPPDDSESEADATLNLRALLEAEKPAEPET